MKLLPAGLAEPSDWEDGIWEEKPGFPAQEGTWIHPPLESQVLPEYEFEEGHDRNRSEPAPIIYIGSANGCHIRFEDKQLPPRLCRVFKEFHVWYLERLHAEQPIYLGDRPVTPGERCVLKNGDLFSLRRPPTPLTYKVVLDEEDNWYLDEYSERDYVNKYPYKFPFHKTIAAAVPEELTRLAQQTDQMRRRSEEDQVRVADWAAFAQYVKRHYLKYGIECKPWITTRRPIDPKPPPYPPRAYPAWIAEIVSQERMQPGMTPQIPAGQEDKACPYGRCLQLSGKEVASPLEYQNGVAPRLEDLYVDDDFEGREGPAVAAARPAPDSSTGEAASGAKGKSKGSQGKDSRKPPERDRKKEALSMTFKEWLCVLDDSKFLMQYHDQIAENFDSLEQICEVYWKDGQLNKSFFDDSGIKKLGHKRIFIKWFNDTMA